MRFEVCPRCDRITLAGIDAGVTLRLSTLVIPFTVAKTLSEWGNLIYTVRFWGKSIITELWNPNYGDKEWLVMEHHCSQDAHNWQFHPPTYGPVKRRYKPAPSPNVRGFEDA